MVIPQYYENPHILHVNTMPNRAYFIPDARRSPPAMLFTAA